MLEFKKVYTLPFKFNIPTYILEFHKTRSLPLTYLKFIKRYLFLAIKRQKKLEIQYILPEHKKILWINISAPSLGDSLMDLSSRILLKDKQIDLYTDKKNLDLYINDSIFSKVFSNINQADKNNYDLVIIDSYSTRSISVKAHVAALTPYVGMFGYFNGPEVNRVLFSFHQMNKLLSYKKDIDEINRIAKCEISISDEDKNIIQNINLPDDFISIALGGEWSFRTYQSWDKVIEKIMEKQPSLNIVLVGSKNAKKYANKILNNFPHLNIFNCVDQFSFNQTAQIIKRAQILICCDGGLMHAANSVKTPIVVMFARLKPEMQLTYQVKAFSVFDDTDVNNILPKNILNQYTEASNFVRNHHLIE